MLTGIGSAAEKGVNASGIPSYNNDVTASAELGRLAGATYNIDDLICRLCLSQHKEAIDGAELPAPAQPVSIGADLGLSPPAPAEQREDSAEQEQDHAQAAASGAPQQQAPHQPEARRRRRKWRSRVLRPPRPTWRSQVLRPPPPSSTRTLAAVLPVVLRCSRVADASSLCQTGHELHADGLPLSVLARARVADSVAIVLSPKGPLAAAWLQAGVRSETVEAMRANVWR